MKNVSFSDILIIPEFKGLREIDLLEIKQDIKVLPYLFELGIDTKQGYHIEYDTHRNLQGKIVEGYKYVGSIRLDKEFTKSPFCEDIDRIVITSYKDPSLTQELCNIMGSTLNYKAFNVEGEDGDEVNDSSILENGWESKAKTFATMNSLVDQIRGNPYGEDGCFKTHKEWVSTISVDEIV